MRIAQKCSDVELKLRAIKAVLPVLDSLRSRVEHGYRSGVHVGDEEDGHLRDDIHSELDNVTGEIIVTQHFE
jgi:hypothetical protein